MKPETEKQNFPIEKDVVEEEEEKEVGPYLKKQRASWGRQQ